MKGQIPFDRIMAIVGSLVVLLVFANIFPYITGAVVQLESNITALPMGNVLWLILGLLVGVVLTMGFLKIAGESVGIRITS